MFFAYIDLDYKYGMLLDNYEMVRQSFMRGKDQRAYDRLISIVEKNAAQASLQ